MASPSEPPVPETTAHDAAVAEARVRRVELVISLVLRIGVTVSVLVIAAGLGLMFAHHPQYASFGGHYSYHRLTSSSTSFPHTLSQLGASLGQGDGRGLVVLGLLLLIATPVLRVAVSVASFVYERDPAMTLVTLFVLAVLIGSFFLGGASA